MAVGRDEQVAGLDIAVDQPAPMGVVQALGRLGNDRGRNWKRQRAVAADQPPQVGAGHVLGHQEIRVAFKIGVRDAYQVRMVELGLARISR